MKKVLFCVALPFELKLIKQRLKLISNKKLDISFLLLGTGNYNSIYNLQNFIRNHQKIDFIVNIGVCGKREKELSDEIFQVYRIKNKSNKRESLIPTYFEFSNLKSILSSETIITTPKSMLKEDYVDMESYGIDFVCNKEKIPFILLKKPFDVVGVKSKNIKIDKLTNIFDDLDFTDLLNKLVIWLDNNNSEEKDLSYYKEYFRFTFSEYEIFKKMYKKFLAYKIDFDDFFKENKELSKKDFLKQMKNK